MLEWQVYIGLKGVERLCGKGCHVEKRIDRDAKHASVASSKLHLELAAFGAENLGHLFCM